MIVKQSATMPGWPCPNCGHDPCGCMVTVAEQRPPRTGPLRRYAFPDGSILRLDDQDGAVALAAGAVLEEA